MNAETKLASKECANYKSGKCLGMAFDQIGESVLAGMPGKCTLRGGGPCRIAYRGGTYFDVCVIPVAFNKQNKREVKEARKWNRV